MPLVIDIQHASDSPDLPADKQLEKWLQAAWLGKPTQDSEVCLRIVGCEEMTVLNSRYRGKDKPTNVLSFPADIPAELALPLLGDIVICADIVAEQATQQEKTASAHWAHMCVHGMLHLQGHDHQNEADALEMETLETHILAELGYASPYQSF